jgi:quinol monooxygenase YgiN
MIGVIAKMKVKVGRESEFEQIMSKLTASIRASEPDNVVYQLCKSRTETGLYVIFELYSSAAAFAAHGSSSHLRAVGAELATTLAERPNIETYDAVA